MKARWLNYYIFPPSGENLLTFLCNPSSKSKISVLPQGEDNSLSIQTNEMLTIPSGEGEGEGLNEPCKIIKKTKQKIFVHNAFAWAEIFYF